VNLKNIKIYIVTAIILCACSLRATDRYIDPSGSDAVNDCAILLSPCLTVQHAVDQSSAGDVIHIAAGSYAVAGIVTINKSLTLLGAQAGIDAQTRVGAESILSNSQGISVSANNVVFDGLTIQDSSVAAFTGYGIWINPGVSGTQVINNIFQNNIVGLGLANIGPNQALIEHNLFKNNNLPGGAGGTAIYTDQYVGGSVDNVVINMNTFSDNNNAAIGFSSTDKMMPSTNITITNNIINNNGRAIYFFNTQAAEVSDNTITNITVPSDGGSSVAIGVYGAVNNLSILRNNLQTGAKYGIRIGAFIGDPPDANNNILIHSNNIVGFATAALQVDTAPLGPNDYATCNWWGSDNGPSTILNPGGTGDKVEGTLVVDNFKPWLNGSAPDGVCGEGPDLSKSFSPKFIRENGSSTLTITLNNPGNEVATLTAALVDNLPMGLKIRGDASNTCGASLSAPIDGSTITVSGGSIPAQGSCSVTVKVSAAQRGSYTNTLPAGALQTNRGPNVEAASARLTVSEILVSGGASSRHLSSDPAVFLGYIPFEPEILPSELRPKADMGSQIEVAVVDVTKPAAKFSKPKEETKPSLCSSTEAPIDSALALTLVLFLLRFFRKHKSMITRSEGNDRSTPSPILPG
jgi:hypothetical protein